MDAFKEFFLELLLYNIFYAAETQVIAGTKGFALTPAIFQYITLRLNLKEKKQKQLLHN
jgi:hypothetical protein